MRRCEGKKPVAKLHAYKGEGTNVSISQDTDCSKWVSVAGLREHCHFQVLVRRKPNEQQPNSKRALILEFTLMEIPRPIIFFTIISVNVLKEQRKKEGQKGREN